MLLGRLSRHRVKNIVISCIDFRFGGDLPKALAEIGVEEYDEIKLAGGAGNLAGLSTPERIKTIMDDFTLAIKTHLAENIYLLNHQNCGAYGMAGHDFPPESKKSESNEINFHRSELKKAAGFVKGRFPRVSVKAGFVKVMLDDALKIEIIEV